jgi:hypothetical protein
MTRLRNFPATFAFVVAFVVVFILALATSPALPAATASNSASYAAISDLSRPVFEADSDLFELVGRIENGEMTLTLDRWASNEPVAGARIEIDSGGRPLLAAAHADGTYRLDAAAFATAATYPLTITITAGDEIDLLAADLVVTPGATAAAGETRISASGIAAALALLAAAGVTGVALLRRRQGERS